MPEGTPAASDNSTTQEVTPAAASPEVTPEPKPEGVDPRSYLENPLLKASAPIEPGAGQQKPGKEPTPESQEPQPVPEESGDKPEFLLDKFKTPEEQAKAYPELEKLHGKTTAEISELRRQNQEFNKLVAQLQQGQQPVGQTPDGAAAPAQATEATIKAVFDSWDEDKQTAFMDELYEDAPKAMAKAFAPLLEQMRGEVEAFKTELTSQVEPLISERQFNEQVTTANEAIAAFGESRPDMEALRPTMQSIFEADAEFYDSLPPEKAIETLYNAAKAQNIEDIKGAPTLDELLSNPEAQAKFAESDAVKQLVLAGQAKQIQAGNPPTVIGSQPGQSTATPPVEIKSTKDAGKALLAKLGLR